MTMILRASVRTVLERVAAGDVDHDAALAELRALPSADPGREAARAHLARLRALSGAPAADIVPASRLEVDDDTAAAVERWAPNTAAASVYTR